MKDYYARYIEKKIKNTSETKVSKVSKGQKSDAKKAFETFDTESNGVNLKTFSLEEFFLENPKLSEQFEFEVDERIAIMVIEGNLSETEAVRFACETTIQIWTALFLSQLDKNMALEIFSNNQWHEFHIQDFTETAKIDEIRRLSHFASTLHASGHELDYIRVRFENVPVTKGNFCKWKGEMASFILTNLLEGVRHG